MLELTSLALMYRVANAGLGPIVATRIVAADPSSARAVVTSPATQQRIVARVPALARARAHVLAYGSPRLVHVGVRVRGRDALWLTWILTPRRGTTELDLAAQVHSRGLVARLALLLGGRRLIAGRLDAVLDSVAAHALHAAEHLDGTAASSGRAEHAEAM